MKYLYGNFILNFWNSTHFLGNKSQVLIPSKYTKTWMAGFSSLPQGDRMVKTPLSLNSSFGSSNACGQQEHVQQGCVFSHMWRKPCNLFFSRKKRKKESKTLFQMPCRLIIFFVILSSVFGFTYSNWHGMDLWGISVPLSSISHGGWGRFLHYTAVVLTLTHTWGGAHISEDLSIFSLAFTGDLRWLEEFAVKDTWIWVLKHLIV